jgi:hypothetical protein
VAPAAIYTPLVGLRSVPRKPIHVRAAGTCECADVLQIALQEPNDLGPIHAPRQQKHVNLGLDEGIEFAGPVEDMLVSTKDDPTVLSRKRQPILVLQFAL